MSDACTCGHSIEEHGNDAQHPGSSGCDNTDNIGGCDCFAYERDEDEDE